MQRIVHRLLVLCGVVLVVMRLYPFHDRGLVSKLFYDDVVHAKIEAICMGAILAFGLSPTDETQSLASHLAALGHTSALVIEALGIALTFYIITRWTTQR